MKSHALLTTALLLSACLRAKDHALFDEPSNTTSSAAASSGGITAMVSGTDSGSGATGGVGASAGAGAGPAAQGGVGAAGNTAGGGGLGTTGGTPDDMRPLIEDCSMVEGAVVSELDGHCYRVDERELGFAEARDACDRAGGHLLTVSSEEEDDFAEALHDGEHWLGATDGRGDAETGVGQYSWVTAEELGYTNWEDGQPNAFETDCPGQDDDADCFEHCAFQTDEGDWNDRSCWHAIVSICEWDVKAAEPGGGSAGAPP